MVEHLTLTHQAELALTPTAPFSFDATVFKPDHFPAPDAVWQPGALWQTMLWQGEPLGLAFQDVGTVEAPRLRLAVWSQGALSDAFLQGLAGEIAYRYNLDLDLADFYARFAGDPQLAPTLNRFRGMRPAAADSLFEYLLVAIVLQNATVRRSVQMMEALLTHYGRLLTFAGRDLYCQGSPQDLAAASEEDLRALKLGYRAKSIVRVTQAFVRGEIDELALRAQPLEQQRAALLGLYGIGPASVGYILFDVFHHLDMLDHISPWEQKVYSRLFFNVPEEAPVDVQQLMDLFAQHFQPYRMLAVHYVWEDLFWRRRHEPVDWLERLIRL
jgi:3-methyladenine DNA glycosylase/8-oxoguanine DNA glycosylase